MVVSAQERGARRVRELRQPQTWVSLAAVLFSGVSILQQPLAGDKGGPKQPQSLQVNTGTPPLGAQMSEDPNGRFQEKSKDGVCASGDFMKFFTPRAIIRLFHFTAKTMDR